MSVYQPKITIPGILSEVILWSALGLGILVVFLSLLGLIGRVLPNNYREVLVFFQDASELSKGAPVKFMGVDVGYVEEVKPLDNLVQVRLRLTRKGLKLPSGSVFSIQFNGLAGAKSLEVAASSDPIPHPETSTGNFQSEDPIRVIDIFNTQTQVSEALEIAYDNVYHSLGELDSSEELLDSVDDTNHRLLLATGQVRRFNDSVTKQTDVIHRELLEATERTGKLGSKLAEALPYTTPAYFNHDIRPPTEAFTTALSQTPDAINHFVTHTVNGPMRQYMMDYNLSLCAFKNQYVGFFDNIDQLNARLSRYQDGLDSTHHYFETHDINTGLAKVEHGTGHAIKPTGNWAHYVKRKVEAYERKKGLIP